MKRRWVIVGGACLVGIGLFLGVSAQLGGRLGFPLDDAWIHQTYARNLARYGRFEYIPGVSSAGSTSPLWTLLLALGYLSGVPYLLWTYLLGGLSLLWLAWGAMAVWRQLWPVLAAKDWLAGVTLVLMWPLLWAAASGMETLLFAALSMQIVALYLKEQRVGDQEIERLPTLPLSRSLLFLGLLSGLLILTRPEGVALVALVLLGLVLRAGEWRCSWPPGRFYHGCISR